MFLKIGYKIMKKITIGMAFFMLLYSSAYSQTIYTYDFAPMPNGSREVYVEVGSTLGNRYEGFIRTERLPNSVQNEIDSQLNDYRPLNNGEVFYWRGSLINSTVSGTVYMVLLRITDARNSRWEYYAYMRTVR
jgi:hypothetical protein